MKAVAGVDIGSLTAKTVILDEQAQVISYCVVQQGIVDEAAANASLQEALKRAGLTLKDISFLITTGYGRTMVKFGHKNITEISCHARGAHYLFPGVRTVIDIGGQDSKVVALDGNGRVVNFAMNDKCAAGTGRFLEVMARALGISLQEMEVFSFKSQKPAHVSSICTVFAESEIISLVAQGNPKTDIIAGIHDAIGRRMLSLTKHTGMIPPVMMTGGVAKNKAVVDVLERMLKAEIAVSEEPQIVGALGAALYALDEVR